MLANMRNTTSFDQVSLLYRFDNVTGLFVEFQAFALSGAFDWEPFVMGGIVAFEVDGGWNPVFDQETYVFELDEDYAFIYDETGHLVQHIEPLGKISTNMNTDEGYENVKNAVLAALGETP